VRLCVCAFVRFVPGQSRLSGIQTRGSLYQRNGTRGVHRATKKKKKKKKHAVHSKDEAKSGEMESVDLAPT
jgi:hypothetical protein